MPLNLPTDARAQRVAHERVTLMPPRPRPLDRRAMPRREMRRASRVASCHEEEGCLSEDLRSPSPLGSGDDGFDCALYGVIVAARRSVHGILDAYLPRVECGY